VPPQHRTSSDCSGPENTFSSYEVWNVSRSSPFRKADLATHCTGRAHLILGLRCRGLSGAKRERTVARAGGEYGASIDVNLMSPRVGNQDNLVRPQR